MDQGFLKLILNVWGDLNYPAVNYNAIAAERIRQAVARADFM
jgi:hypothetical protein